MNKSFRSIFFTRLLTNTILFSRYNLIVAFPIPIIFARLLNEIKAGVFIKIAQMVGYLPHFIFVVVIVGFLNIVFSPTELVPEVLTKTQGSSPGFL